MRISGRWLISILVVLASGIALAGYGYYLSKERKLQERTSQELATIADLKISEINLWLAERYADGKLAARTPGIRKLIGDFLANPADASAQEAVRERLSIMRQTRSYRALAIYDARGKLRLVEPNAAGAEDPEVSRQVQAVLRSGVQAMSDARLGSSPDSAHLDLMVPLDEAGQAGYGLLLFQMDPQEFLYPLLRLWPSPSPSGETVLALREGNEVVYLYDVRFRTNSTALRLPITPQSPVVSVMAARGKAGAMEGLDYRGVPVIAAVRPVAGTSWVIISKIDREEVEAPLRAEAGLLAFGLTGFLLALGLGGALLWRQQVAALLQKQLTTEEALLAKDQRLATLMREANDIVLVLDEQMRVVEFNERALSAYGYTADELRAMPVEALRPAEALAEQPAQLATFNTPKGAPYETVHKRKDGSTFPVEVSGGAGEINGRHDLIAFIRDITQRKEAERHIQQLNRLYAALSSVNQAIIHAASREALCQTICRILVEQGQFKMAWVGWLDPASQMIRPQAVFGDETDYLKTVSIHLDDRREGRGPSGMAFREGRPYVCNDFHADPNTMPWRDAAKLAGIGSLISLPVKREGKVVGILTAYAGECDFFGIKEVALLEEAAVDISFALDNLERDAREIQTRAAVQEREELLSAIFDQAMDSIALVEVATGRFVEFNEAAHKNLGYEREAFARLSVSDIEGQQNPEEIRQSFAQMQQFNGMVLETRYRCRDGGLREVRIGARGITLKGKNYLVAVWTDITERKQAETSLRQSEKRFRSLLTLAPVPLGICTVEGGISYVNDLFTQLFGYTVEDIPTLGQWGQRAYPDEAYRREVREQWDAAIKLARESNSHIQPTEFQVACKNGTVRTVEISGTSLGTDTVVAFFDLTQRRQAESQLQLQSAALNAAANAIVITDFDGNIVWINTAFTHHTGYTLAEATGKNPRLLKSGVQGVVFYENLWATIRSGQVWHGELKNRRKDGTVYDEEMAITPVRSEQGRVTHFIAIKQDISQRKQLEKEYLRAQRMEGIGMLAGGIAHDLNNVLAPVLMSAELLKSSGLPADLLAIIETVESSAKRGADIVKQVLTFARGIEGSKGPIQLRHLVKDMVRMATETFPRNIHFRTRMPGDLWPVQGDATQLHQVLLNLSVNARDAMPMGGELIFTASNTPLDEAGARRYANLKPGNYVKLEVSDTGSGIPPELVDKIFEPFFTTKEQGLGTGLGLSTVIGIVRGHAGSITVESAPGQGARFIVLLPALPGAYDVREGGHCQTLPRGQGELILIVDDEPGILDITGSVLRRQGFRTLMAANGADAVTIFVQHQAEIKLVITDIMMPVMDGVTLVTQLRRLKPDFRCIVSSGLMDTKDPVYMNQLKEYGVKHFLTKPFAMELLLEMVDEVLRAQP